MDTTRFWLQDFSYRFAVESCNCIPVKRSPKVSSVAGISKLSGMYQTITNLIFYVNDMAKWRGDGGGAPKNGTLAFT